MAEIFGFGPKKNFETKQMFVPKTTKNYQKRPILPKMAQKPFFYKHEILKITKIDPKPQKSKK